jgi:hypothetical protein
MKMELVRSYETSKAMAILPFEETEALHHTHQAVEHFTVIGPYPIAYVYGRLTV